jgi:hypothetical protein
LQHRAGAQRGGQRQREAAVTAPFKLDYGWAAPPLFEQLQKQGRITCSGAYGADFFDRCRECLQFMHIHNLITDKDKHSIARRLTRMIWLRTRATPHFFTIDDVKPGARFRYIRDSILELPRLIEGTFTVELSFLSLIRIVEVRGELAIFVVEPQPRKPELKSAIPLPVLLGDTTSSTIFELVLL